MEVFPSPKFQAYVTVPAIVDVFVKFTVKGGEHADMGLAVKEAIGAGEIITCRVKGAEGHPFASVTIILTGKVSAKTKVFVTTLAAPVWPFPSPKSHNQLESAALPGVELSVKVTNCPGQDGIALAVKFATGLKNTVIVDVNVLGVPFDTVNVTVYVPGLG